MNIIPSFAITVFLRSLLLINMEELRRLYMRLSVLLNSSNKQSCFILFELILVSVLEKVGVRPGGMRPMGKELLKELLLNA